MNKYLYILSQRYSGSTLLSFLLATHPEIATIGERRKFYNKVIKAEKFQHHKAKHCSCGKLFIECEYMNALKEEVLRQIDPDWLSTNATELKIYDNKYLNRIAYEAYTLLKPLGITPFSRTIKAHQEVSKAIVKTILEKENSSVFLDSSKIINHALYLSRIEEFDFHVIWLIRDPRAQINSAMKHQGWSLEKATQMWNKEMVNNERILHKFKIKYIQLSYSDLCNNPEDEIKRVLDFVEIDNEKFSLQFREQEHHIMGNYMRLQEDQKITERKEWKEKLSKEQVAYINRKTAKYSNYYS